MAEKGVKSLYRRTQDDEVRGYEDTKMRAQPNAFLLQQNEDVTL